MNIRTNHFRKIFFLKDCCGDHVPAGRFPRRHVLQDPNNDGSSQDFFRHENGDRVAYQA